MARPSITSWLLCTPYTLQCSKDAESAEAKQAVTNLKAWCTEERGKIAAIQTFYSSWFAKLISTSRANRIKSRMGCAERKRQDSFKNGSSSCLIATARNCSINPRCHFPKGNVKIFSNSFVLFIQQRLAVLHGRCSLTGDSLSETAKNQFIHASGWLFTWTDSNRGKRRCSDAHAHTRMHACALTNTRAPFVWKQKRDQNALTSHSRTVFTWQKSSVSGTLESFINI